MNKIKHFMLPEHTNNLYKREAVSSISLTKEVADKLNEIIDYVNKMNLDNIAKEQEQDGRIRKGVIYMKDNLINSIHDLFKTLYDSGDLKDIITNAILENYEMIKSKTTGFVNVFSYGASGDGITNDIDAFEKALEENDHVFIPSGTYKLSRSLKIPSSKKLIGANRNTTILKFSNDVNGVQLDHSVTLENLTINYSGEAAGIYLYTPDNYNFALSSIVRNIRLVHESNTINGHGILLVTEKIGDKPNGAYNLKFEDIDIRNKVKYGIRLLNKAKTNSASECWFTDIKFDNVFINSCETAINMEWEDLSGNVPITGTAPKNDGIYFNNVNAQYVEGVTKCFAKILNGINVRFENCFPFDYYHLYPNGIKQIILNAFESMCRVDLGTCPEVSDLYKNYLPRYIEFVNSSGDFNADASNVITYMKLGATGSIYGKFVNYDKSYDNFNYQPLPFFMDENADTMWTEHSEIIENNSMRYNIQDTTGRFIIGFENETTGVQIIITTSLSEAPIPIIYTRMKVNGLWKSNYKMKIE